MHRLIAAIVVVLSIVGVESAHAQRNPDYNHEFAILTTWSSLTYRSDCEWCGDSNSRVTLTVPSLAPGLRVSMWAAQPLVINLGVTVVESEDERGPRESLFAVEGGLEFDIAGRSDLFHPFVGLSAGAISDAGSFWGIQIGGRYFLRDYAAVRGQFGFRHTLDESESRWKMLELGLGLGFFI